MPAFYAGAPLSTDQRSINKAVAMVLLMVVMGATVTATAKYLTDTVPSQTIVAVQYIICLILTLPGILKHGVSSLKTQRFGLHLFRGIVGVAGFYLMYAGLEHIPLVDATLLRQSAPLCVPLISLLWLRQPVPRRHYLPLLLGFLGVVIILRPQDMSLSTWHILSFVSAITLALSMVCTFKLGETEPSHRVLFYYFALSVICIVPFTLPSIADIPMWAWGGMLYIGVTMYLTFLLYNKAFSLAQTSAIAPLNYFTVPVAGVFGWVIWGHVPDGVFLLGTALVVGAGTLVLVKK